MDAYDDEDYIQAYDEDMFYENVSLVEFDVVYVDTVTQPNKNTASGILGGTNNADSSTEDNRSSSNRSGGVASNASSTNKSNASSLTKVIPLTIGRARGTTAAAAAARTAIERRILFFIILILGSVANAAVLRLTPENTGETGGAASTTDISSKTLFSSNSPGNRSEIEEHRDLMVVFDPKTVADKRNSADVGHALIDPCINANLDACQNLIVHLNPNCPRLLEYTYSEGTGFGHQFTEFLFGIKKAQVYGMTYLFTPFKGSIGHGDDYTFINDMLGLSKLFESLSAATRESVKQLPRVDLLSTNSSLCNAVYTISGYRHCYPELSGNCFSSTETRFLFQDVAGCLRQGVQRLGYAHERCVLLGNEQNKQQPAHHYLPKDTVYVVLHVRVGDYEPHPPNDLFYTKLFENLRRIAAGYKINILLVGKGQVDMDGSFSVASNYLDILRTKVSDVWKEYAPEYIPKVYSPRYTLTESFLSMMQADILVGSGSSLPAVASLVSGVPLFFNHVPKHGYNVGMEMVGSDVDLEFNGEVLDSHRRLRVELHARLNPHQPTACRR
jgi:hypothetical protein